MIQIQNVTKTFEGFKALDALNMRVPAGAVYGLVGPNGAGKSTIIRHICGIYRPDSGEILVDGAPIYENTRIKSEIAYIPDDFYYFPQASIDDMAKFYSRLYPKFDYAMYQRLQKVFPLNRRMPIRRMSKGMQKQAAFWLAICCRPKLLVLDEPVDGLDPVMRRQVWSLVMEEVSEHEITVLISSHNLRELEDVCDHVGIMHAGRMLLERSLSDMQENICKIQLVLPEGVTLPADIHPLHAESMGRVQTLIIRGAQAELEMRIGSLRPILFDLLPLTLEEIFIYELGGADYEVQNILL